MPKHIFNVVPSPEDLRDLFYSAPKAYKTVDKLPKHVDLRHFMPAVYDQGNIGSCTANAAVALREYLDPSDAHLSRRYLYYKARELQGWEASDSGAYIRDAFKAMNKSGVATEPTMPYNENYLEKPSVEAERSAEFFKLKNYRRLTSFNAMLSSLAEGDPVVFAMQVYSSFESPVVAATGRPPMPQDPRFGGLSDEYLGGHAVLAVGYSIPDKIVIVRNSWGSEWGLDGYFALPFGFFDKGYAFDMWTSAG